MDSDILAIGDFVSDLTHHLSSHAGVFSGAPTFCLKNERILPTDCPKMLGRFNQTDNGICLGSTYLALYDNKVLARVMTSTGIGFERYLWTDIPTQYQDWLTEKGLKKKSYDTGKLLNLLLLAQKERLIFQDSPNLLHIGGITKQVVGEIIRQTGAIPKKKTLLEQVKQVFDRLRSSSDNPQDPRVIIEDVKLATHMENLKMKRRIISRYFVKLLQSLQEGRPLPMMPAMDNLEVEKNLAKISYHIMALHKEYGKQLAR
jgi:hypothetical protein